MMRLRQISAMLLVSVLAIPLLSARKTPPVLEWKEGIFWESPDSCIDSWDLFKKTYLIVGDGIIYHVAHRPPISHKPNVTERTAVKYTMADGDFYLQDEDGRVFKLAIVKKELDPAAQERIKSGKGPCQP